LNKAELIKTVAEKAGVSQKDTETIIKATLDTIKGSVAQGDTVTLVGFGTFKRSHREARIGHNPSTGAEITIPARNVPTFVPGGEFKEAVK
jgi:DNA-binding protein HU-beta